MPALHATERKITSGARVCARNLGPNISKTVKDRALV